MGQRTEISEDPSDGHLGMPWRRASSRGRHPGGRGVSLKLTSFHLGSDGTRPASSEGFLRDPRGNPRGEVFKLVSELGDCNVEEATLVEEGLLPRASPELTARLNAIRAYEAFCRCLEEAFDWLRYLSGKAGARALSPAEFSRQKEVGAIASALPKAQEAAGRALDSSTPKVQNGFLALTEMFDGVKSPKALYEAVLSRHAHVQRAKPPDGKREWFEHGPDGRVFVRVPYRMSQPPGGPAGWGRPYRVTTVGRFCNDLSSRA